MGDLAQGHHGTQPRHGFHFRIQEWTAGADFRRRGLVLRGHATHGIDDAGVLQRVAIMGRGAIGSAGEAELQQGAVKQVAGIIPGEGASGAVCSAHAGRKAHDQQARILRTEGGHWRIEPFRLLYPPFIPEGGKARAERAVPVWSQGCILLCRHQNQEASSSSGQAA